MNNWIQNSEQWNKYEPLIIYFGESSQQNEVTIWQHSQNKDKIQKMTKMISTIAQQPIRTQWIEYRKEQDLIQIMQDNQNLYFQEQVQEYNIQQNKLILRIKQTQKDQIPCFGDMDAIISIDQTSWEVQKGITFNVQHCKTIDQKWWQISIKCIKPLKDTENLQDMIEFWDTLE